MNENTRIAISCFTGDQRQIDQSFDLYSHHGCPITVLSPVDGPVELSHALVDNRHAGMRGRSGPVAQARQIEYYKALLSYPEQWFLIHDSDSLCIDPQIPLYLYEDRNVFWCNNHEAPCFMSRHAMEKMVAVGPIPSAVEWVDRYQIELAFAADVTVKLFKHSVLAPISGPQDETGQVVIPFGAERFGEPGTPVPPDLALAYAGWFSNALGFARAGANMIHSVKNGEAAHAMAAAYVRVAEDGPAVTLPPPPKTGLRA
jgi:hypothetical protein